MSLKDLGQELDIVSAFVPVDLKTGANDGDWVSLENYRRCSFVLFKGAGSVTEAPTITIEQAKTAAGSNAKTIAFTTIYKKQSQDLATTGQFTKVTQTAAGTFTETSLGTDLAIVVIGVNAEDLDVENDFKFVRGRVADPGTTAQIGAGLYILTSPRYTPPPSALA